MQNRASIFKPMYMFRSFRKHMAGDRQMSSLMSLIILLAPCISQAQDAPVVTIRLKAVAGLQFDQPRFRVAPGTQVKIVLTNEDDMSHNMVITKPEARERVVDAAMKLEQKGPEKDYIPDSPDVLWTIRVLSPGEVGSVSFTAPEDPGIYPYVCTFPGHGFSMYGAMYVQSGDKLPDLTSDVNIPESRRKSESAKSNHHAAHTSGNVAAPHPYELEPPYLYRAYMENASPASIAVHLPNDISYCWDAGTCELRYAWKGAFVDNAGLWKGKPNAVAKVLGEKFFEIKTRQPLRIGAPGVKQTVEYKGYRLVDRYPEFYFTINDIDVFELVTTNANGTALIRTFRIPDAQEDVWFYNNASDGARYESSTGGWGNNRIKIPRENARRFTITMTKTEGNKK